MQLSSAIYLHNLIANPTKSVEAREVSTKERKSLAKKGQALPDGSFPIANRGDLENAVQAIGRAKNYSAAKRHIIKRARALNALDALPDEWKVS